MLNISKDNNVLITPGKYKSITSVARRPHYRILNKVIIGFLIFCVCCLFLPWTQNIKVMGNVTTLYQEQRPQQLNSPIPGKIIKWYVKNGDYVKKGDTIVTGAQSIIFPENINIGTIHKIYTDNKTNYFTIDVKLFNDMTSLGHVYIIENKDRKEVLQLEAQNKDE